MLGAVSGERYLTAVFHHSRFLSEAVVAHPDWAEELLRPGYLESSLSVEQLRARLVASLSPGVPPPVELSRFRRRQILRMRAVNMLVRPRVTVTDDDGGASTATKNITVANAAPTITSLTGPSTAAEGDSAAFTGAATDVAADTITYTWDYGDGTTGTGNPATHAWPDEGDYTVTLTVTTAPAKLDVQPSVLKLNTRVQLPEKRSLFIFLRNSGGGGAVQFSARTVQSSRWITGLIPASSSALPGRPTSTGRSLCMTCCWRWMGGASLASPCIKCTRWYVYIYIYMYMYVCIYIHTYIYIYMHVCVCAGCEHTHTHA